MQPDILVRDMRGRAVLTVEVKARQNVDRNWAAEFRRNLQAHGSHVLADYFMIVTTEHVFLWTERDDMDPVDTRLPDNDIATSGLFGRVDHESLANGQTLELVVSAWLGSIIRATGPSDLSEPARAFLVSSGLFDALRGAVVALEPV